MIQSIRNPENLFALAVKQFVMTLLKGGVSVICVCFRFFCDSVSEYIFLFAVAYGVIHLIK